MAGTAGGVCRTCLVALGSLAALGCRSASPDPGWQPAEFEIQTSVDGAVPGRHSLAEQVWGLNPSDPAPALDAAALPAMRAGAAPASQEPVKQDPVTPESAAAAAGTQDPKPAPGKPQDPEPVPDMLTAKQGGPSAHERSTLRARFGSTILIAPDGTVTKQYFVTGETGRVVANLLVKPDAILTPTAALQSLGPMVVGGGANMECVLAQMLGDEQIEVFFVHDFDVPQSVKIRGPDPAKKLPLLGGPEPVQLGAPTSMLLVSAKATALAAFEGALNLFFASIPQIEIEVKVVEFSTTDTLAFGIEPIDSSTPTLAQQSSKKLINDIVSNFPLAAPLVGTASIADRGIVTLGGIHDAWQLNAQIQALEARGVADILSSPRMVVRNGGIASIITRTDFPYPDASISASGVNVTSNIKFRPVGVTLNILPVIAGTETIILQVYANISAVTSFASTQPVTTPIISNREVVTSVHMTSGKTTVIGGLVSSQLFEQTSQFPILGDIPILGLLFRSTSTSESKTTLEFHITPRILRGPRSHVGGT